MSQANAGIAGARSPRGLSQGALAELKTRARLRLRALKQGEASSVDRTRSTLAAQRWPWPQAWQLRLCLNVAAAEAGFSHWEHARTVLGGQARPGDDMGTFWHAPGCNHLLNEWFAGYAQARQALGGDASRYLLPYRHQFVVADDPYLRELGLAPSPLLWAALAGDLVAGYGTRAWAQLCLLRLRSEERSLPAHRTTAPA